MISNELLLTLLIVGLYLHDSTMLVHANEAFLEMRFGGHWVASFPTRRFTLLGKHVHLRCFFPPNSLLFRASWMMEKDAPPAPGWEVMHRAIRHYRWSAGLLFVLVLILLPCALLIRAGDAVALIVIAAIYTTILATVVALWLHRHALGLSTSYCLRLCAEMLLCPPVAANVARRLSLHHAVAEDFVSACRRLLQPADWTLAAAQIAARIEDEIEVEGEGTARQTQLIERKATLA